MRGKNQQIRIVLGGWEYHEFPEKVDDRLLFILGHLEEYLIATWDPHDPDENKELTEIWKKSSEWWRKHEIIITDLLRSKARAKKYGRPNSSHVYGRAADIRCRNYTEMQIAEIEDFLMHHWGPMLHVIHHDSGRGAHIHININKVFSRERWNEEQ